MGQNAAAALVELVAVAAGSIVVVDCELAGSSPRWQQIGLAEEQVDCLLARAGFGIGGCPS